MKELHTEIEIAAPPKRVWEVLTDFGSYPEWNPFIRQISGRPAVGSKLEVTLEPPDGRAITMKPSVLTWEPNRELTWLGRLGLPGIFDGEHHFQLQPRDGGTLFVQREAFKGVLVPLVGGVLKKTQRGFGQMNAALKQRAET